MIVLDASVVVKLLVQESSSALALDRVEHEPVRLAPSICVAEVANALSKKVRYDGLPIAAATEVLGNLPAVVYQLIDTDGLIDAGMALSVRCRHALYDCLYLALAIREGCVLLTADAKFVTACRLAGLSDMVELLGDGQ
ncbi:type II toxin-antitoxin system VapC family toxin [uncultured Sphingomonas sp.]|uniref:type II toxin-antitoxin system VapC family toxin n=1 Tax=uncultured Sphingomonas sp. TaxID=158754 RepID=UPI0025E092F0|nr:type II toxin-antitoxin system VapC family toxin [uncultured Sphingomonas sp.]